MKYTSWILAIAIVLVSLFAVAFLTTSDHSAGTTFGDNDATELATATVYPGASADTTVVGTSTSRTYLEIINMSTSSAQALYCATNDRPATVYAGIVIFASSSKVLENYQGALHCKTASATSGVSVISR